MRIFADMHAIKHTLNSKTEAHSFPLRIVGERANKREPTFTGPLQVMSNESNE